ncbi:MAG: CRISPR-associated endonuclease Cas6 [Microscillaceae bacterium]|nr:CRISPR-associated endonuclease Cas6 [Microscillaceae bacterium]
MPDQILKVLKVVFDAQIRAGEIPAFRGAIAAKVGLNHDLFHNHAPGSDQFIYRYPLIQYKRQGEQPMLLCLSEGVDEIHKYFEQRDWSINLSGRTLDMKIARLDLNQFTLQLGPQPQAYQINRWLALNQEKYRQYQALSGLTERVQLLERILTANILAFAKGVQWEVPGPIALRIQEILRENLVPYKAQKLMAFDLRFQTNVFLPRYIGLGGKVSVGFGTVKPLRPDANFKTSNR